MFELLKIPRYFEFDEFGLKLQALDTGDEYFYVDVFSDKKLMTYISDTMTLININNNFQVILAEHQKSDPRYVCFTVKSHHEYMGLLSLKKLKNQTLELGVVLLEKYHGYGWSKKLQTRLMNEVNQQFQVVKYVAYCRFDNHIANNLYSSLGFDLAKQFKHKSKDCLMYKWILNQSP